MANTGCCGMDCERCEAYRATREQDNAALAKIAAREEGQGFGSFILPSRMRCTGCVAPGEKSLTCASCPIRECAMLNHIPHCGFCPDFPCELGSEVWEAVPEYKHNLDCLKSR